LSSRDVTETILMWAAMSGEESTTESRHLSVVRRWRLSTCGLPILIGLFHPIAYVRASDAQSQERGWQVLLPRDAGASLNRRFHRAEACRVLNQLDPGADRLGSGGASSDVERDDRAEAFRLAAGCVGWLARPGYGVIDTSGWSANRPASSMAFRVVARPAAPRAGP
jgi:hypothetical protein